MNEGHSKTVGLSASFRVLVQHSIYDRRKLYTVDTASFRFRLLAYIVFPDTVSSTGGLELLRDGMGQQTTRHYRTAHWHYIKPRTV